MRKKLFAFQVAIIFIVITTMVTSVSAATSPGSLTFSNTPLTVPEGESEPAISIAGNGTMAITGLQWLFDPAAYGTHLWTGPFGSTPTFRGLLDADLRKSGKSVFGSGDADVDLGSTGTLHASTLIFLINTAFNNAQLGVSAIACRTAPLRVSTSTPAPKRSSTRPGPTASGSHRTVRTSGFHITTLKIAR